VGTLHGDMPVSVEVSKAMLIKASRFGIQ
jgi:hypothetical protein